MDRRIDGWVTDWLWTGEMDEWVHVAMDGQACGGGCMQSSVDILIEE